MAPGRNPSAKSQGREVGAPKGRVRRFLNQYVCQFPISQVSCNGHFDNWQTSLGCRSGMPSSQERAGRRPQKAKVTRSNRVGCARFHWGRRRESRTLPRKRDGSIGFPIDGGCSHRLDRAVAKCEFLDRVAPRTKLPIFPDWQTFSGSVGISPEVIFQISGRVNLVP
jgi:hypothetical protein